MKHLLLAPYPGRVHVARSRAEFSRFYRRKTSSAYTLGEEVRGVTITLQSRGCADEYLVYGKDAPTLAHEIGHVVLKLFTYVGIEPASGGGEPFCYMLSHLLEEARKK